MWKLKNPNVVFYYLIGDAIGDVFFSLIIKIFNIRSSGDIEHDKPIPSLQS